MAVFHPSQTSILPIRFPTLSFVLISLDSPTPASTLLTLAWLCSPSRLLASAHPSFFCHLAPPCIVDPVFSSVPDPSFCPHGISYLLYLVDPDVQSLSSCHLSSLFSQSTFLTDEFQVLSCFFSSLLFL